MGDLSFFCKLQLQQKSLSQNPGFWIILRSFYTPIDIPTSKGLTEIKQNKEP